MKKELEKVITQIKSNSKDSKFADKLIDKLLSIKGQMDTKPTLVNVESDDVLESITEGGMQVYKTDKCIVVHTAYRDLVLSSACMASDAMKNLYINLDYLLELHSVKTLFEKLKFVGEFTKENIKELELSNMQYYTANSAIESNAKFHDLYNEEEISAAYTSLYVMLILIINDSNSDMEITLSDIEKMHAKYIELNKKYSKLFESELQKETIEKDENFKKNTLDKDKFINDLKSEE